MDPSGLKLIPRDQVSTHARRGDCWVVIHDRVFDVSKWMESQFGYINTVFEYVRLTARPDHPGGYEILLDYAQRKEDAGEEFESIKHGEDARKIAIQYLIGKVTDKPKPFSMKASGHLSATPATPVTPQNVSEVGDSGILIYGGIAAAAIAVGYYLYKKRSA